MLVTHKRALPHYHKRFPVKEAGFDVNKYLRLVIDDINSDCPVCHGTGLSDLNRCQAIKDDDTRCESEAINHLVGNDGTNYFLCGKHINAFGRRVLKEKQQKDKK